MEEIPYNGRTEDEDFVKEDQQKNKKGKTEDSFAKMSLFLILPKWETVQLYLNALLQLPLFIMDWE